MCVCRSGRRGSDCCQAVWDSIRQSWPESGHAFQAKQLQTLKWFPFRWALQGLVTCCISLARSLSLSLSPDSSDRSPYPHAESLPSEKRTT